MEETISNDVIHKIGDELMGTCKSISRALDYLEFELGQEEVEDRLLDISVEQCKGCGWWFESCELADEDDDKVGYCDQCREE